MRIGFWHSIDHGGSPLMGGLQRGLESLGHTVLTAAVNGEYDLLLVFNQVSHVTHYVYPQWPIRQCPIAFIDAAEYGYFKRLPGVINRYANAFSEGSITHDTKNDAQQIILRRYVEGRSFPYFIREMSHYVEWPENYHPIDYPLYHLSVCDQRPDRDEYLRRAVPFWQSWGASHPWRWPITHALREAGYTCLVIEEDGHPRLPQMTEYFPNMIGARACCSFDGYGSGSFRRTEVLVRTVLLDGPLSIRTYAPLIDGRNVVKYDVTTEGEEFVRTNIVQKLQKVLECPEWAYEIYENAYHHCMTYYTERVYAEYVLRTVEAHDYSKPTTLDIGGQYV